MQIVDIVFALCYDICMNKRIIQILIGITMSFAGVLISIISLMNRELPILLIILGYISAVAGLYLIIFGFLKYYRK